MRGLWGIGLAVAFAITPAAGAVEHEGHEHGGAAPTTPAASAHQAAPDVSVAGQPAETDKTSPAEVDPSPQAIRQTISDYVSQIEGEEGSFTIDDEVTGKTRTLKLERVHDEIGKTDELSYVCTDMRDTGSEELLDVDFDVESFEEGLDVVDVRIHQVNGKPRYTYGEHGDRVPVKE